MKELMFLVLISCLVLHVCATPQQCCRNGEVIKNKMCGSQKLLNLNCSAGMLLIMDIVLDGDKVSTLDAPGFTFAEDTRHYCVGNVSRDDRLIPMALVCFDKPPEETVSIETTGILTLISVLFLIFTIAVYTYLPQMRDLQGLCYISMCVSMALGFLSLGILQLSPGFTGEICTVTGFLVYFWMMATFFWMNVICVNMYRSVNDSTYLKKTEMKQFFWYSCYAWGITFFFLFVSLITNFVEGDHYKPGIGKNSCWFRGRTETWIFFYGPISIIVAANVMLFVMSSLKLWQHTIKYEVNKLNNLKHKFLLSLKLFLVMGISWVFEIASFAHGQSHFVWTIMDLFNCLQGVVIFILLVVLRRRAMQGLAQANFCPIVTRPLAEKLSPHDDLEDQQILADDTAEVRLN